MLRRGVFPPVGLMLLALAILAAAPALAQDGAAVPFVTIAAGETSGIHEPEQLVIRDQATWLSLWRRHAASRALPVPAVGFDQQMIIAMFAGQSRVPRSLTIRRIVQESGRLVVWYTLRDARPLPDGEGLTPAAPFQIVRLARSSLPVRFSQIKTPQVYLPPP